MNWDDRKPLTATVAGLVVVVGVVIAVASSVLAGVLGDPQRTNDQPSGRIPALANGSIPQPVQPAFVPSNDGPLSKGEQGSRWAPVRTAVIARKGPRASAAVVSRLGVHTPERTANIVSVLGSKAEGDNLWIHINLPVLPNGTTGWVPRRALGGYGFVTTRLIVDVKTFRMTLFRRHRPIFKADIGVGSTASPTPKGNFYVRDKVTDFANPFYGPVAFGTSARSSTLTDWPGGGFIGIHGTDQPSLIPGAISHGCIRLSNRDITRLARLMPVGTPVSIR